MERFKGKAIYQPSGKAAEYAPWACNFYTGCSNDCWYCYCKKGVLAHTWSNSPQLKKCFKNDAEAITVFENELIKNKVVLQKTGIFFSFTTDPMLPETKSLTLSALYVALCHDVPVQVLTKRADWIKDIICEVMESSIVDQRRHLMAFGFTLTGHDELEPGASSDKDRIKSMKALHKMGFKTFASIEPIIDPSRVYPIIEATRGFCDLYKLGLLSHHGKKYYDFQMRESNLYSLLMWLKDQGKKYKFYIKDSYFEYFNLEREAFTEYFVSADYNIFQ